MSVTIFCLISLCFLSVLWNQLATGDNRFITISNLRLTKLATFERTVLALARETSRDYPPQFLNFVSNTEKEYSHYDEDPSVYTRFPINQYRLIRRFSKDWPAWKTLIKSDEFLSRYDSSSKQFSEIDKFSEKDFIRASHSLSRLQLYYKDNAMLIPDDTASDLSRLTALEMLDLAAVNFASPFEEYHKMAARQWLVLAVHHVRKYRPYGPLGHIIDYIVKHRDTYGSPHLTAQSADGLNALQQVQEALELELYALEDFHRWIEADMDIKVCRNQVDQANGEFHCFYFHSPFEPYAPFKFEILNREPYVALVHNLLPPNIIRDIVNVSHSRGSYVSGLVGDEGSSEEDLLVRSSEGIVFENEEPLSRWFDRRIHHATLLFPNSVMDAEFDGETTQLANYGLAGFYHSHFDFFEDIHENGTDLDIEKFGNRLATVLVYLSSVPHGGNTAFPEIGVSAVPTAGKALVWFNLDPQTGAQLNKTLHEACPVNVGDKWIVTKWIREFNMTARSRPILDGKEFLKLRRSSSSHL